MIGFGEARERLLAKIAEIRGEPQSEAVPLGEALGRVTARSILAQLDLPPFDSSAMDGFAVRAHETAMATPSTPVEFGLAGVVYAGDAPGRFPSGQPAETPGRLRRGVPLGTPASLPQRPAAIQVMTGAPIPTGADAVIEIEKVRLENGRVVVTVPVASGTHIRCTAEDVRRGEEILAAGIRLRPAEIAILAAQGCPTVRVTSRPKVSVVSTGQELVAAGGDLPVGSVFDSNLPFLIASLRGLPVEIRLCRSVPDDTPALREALEGAFAESDFLLVTGGVSMGTRDFTRRAFEELGVSELFWRVAQKPGGPLYVGTRGRTVAAGLPGNPYAVFACFHLYIRPALLLWAGAARPDLPRLRLPLSHGIERDPLRSLLLKGRITGRDGRAIAEVLPKQGSHMTSSLAGTDILIHIEAGGSAIREGEIVDVFVLPS